ncbi:MAG TPA: Fic family protein [Gemmatimonadaceae bacterium]|nr:Fic family protein [Gemmatimonadaceae bacterium]
MPGTYETLFWRHDPTAHAPPRYRRACRYRAFIPAPLAGLRIDLDAETAGAVSHAEHEVAALNAEARPALVPLARLLLRTESIASSKVEGLHIGIRDLARAEARAEGGGRVAPTAREILGNIAAMQLAVERAAGARAFGIRDVLAIHACLMDASPAPRLGGKVRAEQNWVGGNDYNPCGADFVPPPPELVHGLLGDLCNAVNDDALPPLVQAAIVHAQFETIHPFVDGNGRAGRALIPVILKRRGLAPDYVPPVSVVLAAKRTGYFAGLADFRGDGVAAWIARFADAMGTAAGLARGYIGAVASLQDRWRGALSANAAPRADAAAWALIDVLPGYPMLSAAAAIAATGRARAAVYQAIEQLIDAAVLRPASESRRNAVWEPAGLLDLLERMEEGRLPA